MKISIEEKKLTALLKIFYSDYFDEYLNHMIDGDEEQSVVTLFKGMEFFLELVKELGIKFNYSDIKDYIVQEYENGEEIYNNLKKQYNLEFDEYMEKEKILKIYLDVNCKTSKLWRGIYYAYKKQKNIFVNHSNSFLFGNNSINIISRRTGFTNFLNSSKYKTSILNDGKNLNESNINISWSNDDTALITLTGEEQNPELITVEFSTDIIYK